MLAIGIASCNSDHITKSSLSGARDQAHEIASLDALKNALGKANFGRDQITAFSAFGDPTQSAVSTIVRAGMPTDEDSYIVVSAGDASDINWDDTNNYDCALNAEFAALCSVGGVDVSVTVPPNASVLSFDFVYFTRDIPSYDEPFQVFLTAGASTNRIVLATVSSETSKSSNADETLAFGTLRHVDTDVTAWRGQTVMLRFQAANQYNTSLPSGAMIDNLHFDDASTGPPPNTAPTVTLTAPSSANEGSLVSVTANVADADGDAMDVEWDFNGDGVADFTDHGVAPGSVSHSWTYADNGAAAVAVTVKDPSAATASANANITINNVAPSVASFTVTTSAAGAASASASFTDVGTADTHTASIAWGDGNSSAGTVSESNGSGSVSGTHAYAGAGSYMVTVTVTDDDGASGDASVQYVRANMPPTVTLDAPSANEGSAVSVTASVTDPDGGVVDLEWDFNGDGVADFTDHGVAVPSSMSHSWIYADNGNPTVVVTAKDPAGATASGSTNITINNVAPSIASLWATATVKAGRPASAKATFADRGTQDTHTVSIDWGDGTSSAGAVTESNGSGSGAGSHTYTRGGLYTVRIRVTDDDGGSAVGTWRFIYVWDPPVWLPNGKFKIH